MGSEISRVEVEASSPLEPLTVMAVVSELLSDRPRAVPNGFSDCFQLVHTDSSTASSSLIMNIIMKFNSRGSGRHPRRFQIAWRLA